MGSGMKSGQRKLKRKQPKNKIKQKRNLRDLLPPDWDILAVILLLALALRMWFAISYDATLYDQAGEGVRYLGQVRGETVDSASPPLYILFLRICLGIFGRGAAKAAFILKAVVGTVSVALVYYIATAISDRTTAVISAAASALYINYMMAGLALSPRVPGILFLFAVTLILIRARESGRGNLIAGAVLGLGILVDPYLLLFAPGLLLVSRKRWKFLVSLLIVLMPWALRNSIREGIPVPVYSPEALEVDLARWKVGNFKDLSSLVDKLYINASMLCSRGAGWVEPPGSTTSENIRHSTTFGAYLYLVTVLSGLVGLLRYHSRDHIPLLYPALIYLGLLVLFSTCRNTNRLLAEHVALFYMAVLLPRIVVWFRSRRAETPSPQ